VDLGNEVVVESALVTIAAELLSSPEGQHSTEHCRGLPTYLLSPLRPTSAQQTHRDMSFMKELGGKSTVGEYLFHRRLWPPAPVLLQVSTQLTALANMLISDGQTCTSANADEHRQCNKLIAVIGDEAV